MTRYSIDLSCFDNDVPALDFLPPDPIKIMCFCQPAKPGPPGPPGKRGRRGRDGPIGTKGDQGEKGPQGRQGDRGYDGIPGPKGEPGRDIKGEPGERGLPGEKGEPGPPPSQEQIMAALIQVIEDRGIISVKGYPGVDGQNGRDGQDGRDGQNGQNGQDGKDGWSPTMEEIREMIQQCMPQPSFPTTELIPLPTIEWSQYLIKITNARNIMAEAFVMLSATSLNVAGYVPMYEGKYSLETISICSTNHKRSICVRASCTVKPFKLILVSPGYEACVMPRQASVENSDVVTLDFEDISTYEQHIESGTNLFLTAVW